MKICVRVDAGWRSSELRSRKQRGAYRLLENEERRSSLEDGKDVHVSGASEAKNSGFRMPCAISNGCHPIEMLRRQELKNIRWSLSNSHVDIQYIKKHVLSLKRYVRAINSQQNKYDLFVHAPDGGKTCFVTTK